MRLLKDWHDWLRAAAQRKDRLRNPTGHWIDFCKRRAQQQKREGGVR